MKMCAHALSELTLFWSPSPYPLTTSTPSLLFLLVKVLHMHMTDDQSWPLVLSSYPLLAERGAFSPNHTYTLAQLDGLIEVRFHSNYD